jgi:hypothetical protein
VLELQVCPAPFEQKIVNKGILWTTLCPQIW